MGLRAGTWLAGGIAALVAGVFVAALRPADEAVVPDDDGLEAAVVPVPVTLDGRRPGAAAPTPAATDAGDPRERPGSVRMRVVRAPDDAPVPGIPVFLRRDVAPRGPFHLLAWTDERGLVAFPEVWPGTGLRLRVQAGAGPRVERDDVVVRAGEATDLGDVRLDPLGLVDALVVDEVGKPIEDARVVATLDPETIASLDTDAFPLPPDPPSPVAAGRSDNHGRVRLEGVPPGIVALRATKPPLRGATDRVRVPAAGADSAVVTIVLRPGALAGLAVSADGRPVADLPVRFGEQRLDDFFVRGTAITDAEGFAILGGFARHVRFDAEFDVPGRGTFSVVGLGVGGAERVTLGAAGRYAVRVVDETGRPVAGARVGARSTATRAPLIAPAAREGTRRERRRSAPPAVEVVGVTGSDGRVTLDTGGPPSGLWAVHPDYLAYGDAPGLQGDTVPPPPSDDRAAPRIVLLRGVRVTGHVTDPKGARAPGAIVRAVGDAGRDLGSTRTDEKGEFVLPAVVPERVRWITASRELPTLFGWCRLPRGHRPHALTSVHVALAEPARVRGRVTDARGARVEGARVSIVGTLTTTWTDARGEFVLGPLLTVGQELPPSMVVEATSVGQGVARVVQRWPRPGAEPKWLELSVGETKDVEGYVQDADRRSIPFPIVELIDVAEPTEAVARRIVSADEFGRFVVRDVLPGTYQVRARARGLDGFADGTVEVRADPRSEPKVAPVTVRPAPTIRGTVVLASDGMPVADARVVLTARVQSAAGRTVQVLRDSTQSDAQGRFTFSAPGLIGGILTATSIRGDGRNAELKAYGSIDGDDTDHVELGLR
ncbi:MAG: hypothetical protein JNM10_07920 [Planctomycetia bacterium]|nr:hypothetical protein [Planctomycetia bacterium]